MFKYTKVLSQNLIRIPSAYCKWMLKFSHHPEKYPFDERYKILRKFLTDVISKFNIDIHVVGQENLTDNISFYVSDHVSMFDPLIYIISNEKPFSIVAKKEVEKYPFVGKCVKSISGEFIDRKDLKQSLKLMMRVQADMEAKNKSWMIFPEGTRNKNIKANLGEFHSGTFRAPMKAKVDIVPCAIYGSFRIGQIKPQYKKHPIYIEYGKPITPEDYKDLTTEEVASLVQARVQSMITFNARPYDNVEMSKLKDKRYKFNSVK